MSKTLIFPAVTPSALVYLAGAADRDEPIVAAASELDGEIQRSIKGIRYLPSIYDNKFCIDFLALVDCERIERVFCPVSTVFSFLKKFLAAQRPSVRLIGDSPVKSQIAEHAVLMRRAQAASNLATVIASGLNVMSLTEIASLLKHATTIYGESNEAKLAAMIGIASSVPPGDVVEIGSLMGRSAFVLMYLSARFGLGNILTVDPWSALECMQKDSPDVLQSVVDDWDYDVLSQAFAASTQLLNFQHRHLHLRMTSEHGYEHYVSRIFPPNSTYTACGNIALIHIDGNHDHELVRRDCELWLPHMQSGGWLILGDYLWAHGDGPYRVGNDLLANESERIENAFVCGKALFVRWL